MPPSPSINPFTRRLAALRRRLRFVAIVHGTSCLAVLVLLLLLLEGLLDYALHLPGVVRAFFLVAALAGGGAVAFVYLIKPLGRRDDDLSLALQVEQEFPELNDCLASTVQFLEKPGDGQSDAMCQAAVRQALSRTAECDFNRIVKARGLRLAALLAVLFWGLAMALLWWQPTATALALHRLAHPFSSLEWPPETLLTLDPTLRTRIARGEPFEVHASLAGVIPEKAVVRYWFDGSLPSEQVIPVQQPVQQPVQRSDQAGVGALHARLEPLRVQKSFRFQVEAHDAVTPWLPVTVLPPVAFVPLDGRPSPQITQTYPGYTDLPPQALPPGTSALEGVLGTLATIRAATDRPISRGWIEYHPDQPGVKVGSFLGLLAARHGGETALTALAGQTVWGGVPIECQTQGPGSIVRLRFAPWISGTYALRLIDDADLASSRLFDVRIFADPAPTVTLERPSASRDSLAVLPTATVTLQAVAEDDQYAVRATWLEYRTNKDDPPRFRPLYDHRALGLGLPLVLGSASPAPLRVPPPFLRLRPGRVEVAQRLVLRDIRRLDAKALQEGDVVILQAAADDFDNVSPGKLPGKSHEVELRIVGLPALEALLHQAQEQVQQELQRVREQERAALKKVDGVEKQWRNTGKLRLEDLDQLLQAEQAQQEIRGRIGTKEEGLRAAVDRIRQTLRDNNLPRASTHDRMEMVARELDRLAREELDQIEPLLTGARKENELAQDKAQPDKRARGSLTKAVQHQEEVERTLTELLAGLDPYSSTRQARAETRALLQEERKLGEEIQKLGKETPAGRKPEQLPPENRANLERAAEEQARLAEQARELLNKMDRIAAEKQRQADEMEAKGKELAKLQEEKEAAAEKLRAANPQQAQQLAEEARNLRKEAEAQEDAARSLRAEAEALQKAAAAGRAADVQKQMAQASQNIKDNKLGNAGQQQQQSTQALEKMARTLEDRREEELDLLAKKLREAQQELERLVEEQDLLQKKVKDAQQLADPKERAEALQRLAREQEKLRKESREMAQQLTRLRAGKAGQALRDAGGQMDQAGQQLERGEDAQEDQDGALERLQDAADELAEAQEQAENELARERLIKIAEQIKLLRERQEAQPPESERLQKLVLQKKLWDVRDTTLSSMLRQREAQNTIGEEAGNLAKDKLKDADVFAHIMTRSARAMEQAAASIKERVDRVVDRGDRKVDGPAEEASYQKTVKLQREALNYLDQLLGVLKEEEQKLAKAAGGGEGGGGGGGGNGPDSDGIPPMAQLKLLKLLQLDVNQRTEEFGRKHPDAARLTADQKKELAVIRQDQADVSDLLDKLTAPEGGKP